MGCGGGRLASRPPGMSGMQKQPTKPKPDQPYILRVWAERPAGDERPGLWRLSLEGLYSGDRVGFQTAEEMAVFLNEIIQQRAAK
jgi:hypothetical protein